ncbi:MAG: FAD-dependent oxidoreductase [Chloroflexi bacterium]|nr:FAD-dependent oxidoreductase [Chloroflexota bacterium]
MLRNRIIEAFERADVEHDPDLRRRLLSFVIVGGGATGVELAASLSDMIFKSLLPNYQSISANEIRLAIIEARGSILAGWNPRMAELASHRLTRRHVEIMVNTTVSRVTDSAVETNEGQHIPTATVAWAAGVRPEPTVSSLPVPKERDGRIRVDENLEIPGHPGVFVIGDAAAVVPAGASRPLPPTAAVAVDEGPVSAKNAVRRLTDQPLQPFHYHSRGDLVSLGRGAAAADIYGVVFDGIPAWLVRNPSGARPRRHRV